MSVLPHARYLHLRHLVNLAAIPAWLNRTWLRKDAIHLLHKGFIRAEEFDETLHIVENAPDIVPSITLGIRSTPNKRVERLHTPLAVLASSPEELRLRIPEIQVIMECPFEYLLVKSVATTAGKFPCAPVVISILQRLCHASMRLWESDVAQLPILFPTSSTVRATKRSFVHSLVSIGSQSGIRVERVYPFCPRICQKRYTMVATHAASLARARPCRQPSELLLRIEKGLHVASLLRGMQDICQRELASEGVPKAVVGQHIPVVNLPVIGTVVIRSTVIRLILIEVSGEEVSSEEATIKGSQLLFAASFHLDAVQQGIPRLEASLLCLFQVLVRTQFRAPVLPGLFLGDIA